jgi:hypothetical protein
MTFCRGMVNSIRPLCQSMASKNNYNSVGKETSIRPDTVTFRIDHNLLVELRKESKHKSESLNTLVNQIIDSYVNYHNPLQSCGNIYFSKALLSKVFNSINDEQLGCRRTCKK